MGDVKDCHLFLWNKDKLVPLHKAGIVLADANGDIASFKRIPTRGGLNIMSWRLRFLEGIKGSLEGLGLGDSFPCCLVLLCLTY